MWKRLFLRFKISKNEGVFYFQFFADFSFQDKSKQGPIHHRHIPMIVSLITRHADRFAEDLSYIAYLCDEAGVILQVYVSYFLK